VSLSSRLADAVLGPPVPAEELPCALPAGVTVRRSRLVPAVGGWLMGTRRPAAGVTLGRTILVPPGSRPTDDLIVHELVHVEQWSADPLFPLRYCAGYLRHGYRGNPYEAEAYARQREHLARRSPTTHPPRTP
jgi:hypothetical protein